MDIDFTNVAWESLYSAVDDELFPSQDAELIYDSLKNKFPVLAFGDYLKRYIYQKAELTEPFSEVTIDVYQDIIKQAFRDNSTPVSFEPTTAKIGALTKNWLTQKTVNRKVVFLLGFGLNMSPTDVDQFLQKALREQKMNPKDPFEVICRYCFSNHFDYFMFEQLWERFEKLPAWSFDRIDYLDNTMVLQISMKEIKNENDLFEYLSHLKLDNNTIKISATAHKTLTELYDAGREMIAKLYNEEENEKEVKPEDITESDFENIICSAINKDKNGNLVPTKFSELNEHFYGKRLSRQRLRELLTEKTEVSRFDLITMKFFLYSQKLDEYSNIRKRYTAFCEDTNDMLEKCFMGPLYVSNPYERFILMCILSEDPLGTYADVWEMSLNN